MGAGHSSISGLQVPGSSVVHRLDPAAKVAATFVFVLAVVSTPREAFWSFGLHAAVIAACCSAARLSARHVARRARVEVPFVAFAVLLPFFGSGPHTEVLGLQLSEPGLWAAWNIVAKGTLGVLAATVLTATTPIPDLLHGLDRLHVPRVVTSIAGFMVRYLDVVTGEARRMRIARLSRGDDPRWLWQGRAVAATAGTLFVRAYERGERVHVAMQARGYTGVMPPPRRGREGLAMPAAVPAVAAVLVAAAALVVSGR